MKYYQIGVSAEPKTIGVKNGVYQFKIDYERMSLDNLFDSFLNFFDYSNKDFWKNQELIKKIKIPVIKGEMLKKAKVTDFMGYSPEITFLNRAFSSKYLGIVKEYEVENLGIFEIDIKDVLQKYYLLINKAVCLTEIDFSKSIIVTGHSIMDNVKFHHMNDHFEYVEFLQKNPLANFKVISISKKNYGKDIIDVQSVVNPFYSEKLITRLLDEGITGLEINYENSIALNFI
ncbi:hypothetical protein Flavo103_09700 [Flavobacterium collinsii]|uniref:hypothetical protein n=1 Tax=Flavobacterium collinsii TaxID=1114861 RepID=UPI0022C2BD57|nr:hypothetical protein [Flavobacterium collinsii]GIQ57834.1 hypothetical protein Flavo103_09700 [Flavobacterium collinsii]